MSDARPTWRNGPEYRIIRELRETRIGGLAPGKQSNEFGRVVETLLIRELQMLARERSDVDLRFARGYIVEDYGDPESGEVSLSDGETVEKTGPRFDIVCYRGNVAWSTYERMPVAIVPKSLAYGVIEVKRTVSPKRFGPDSNEHFNEQLVGQRDYLRDLGADVLRIVVGANYFGTKDENRRKALADYVALLGDLNKRPSASKMVTKGELAATVDLLLGIEPSVDEKMTNLQNIAKGLNQEPDESDE